MAFFLKGDAARIPLADDSVDMVFGSPPYLKARTYGINADRDCRDWIDWMLQVTAEGVRVSHGLCLWVCAGTTEDWCYQPGPEGLLYRWWEQGGRCWRCGYWLRDGIPGSGGTQGLKARIEYVLFFTKCTGPLPWANNTAMGHPPQYEPGGAMSNRQRNGSRIGKDREKMDALMVAEGLTQRDAARRLGIKLRGVSSGSKNGDVVTIDGYVPPELANPGNFLFDRDFNDLLKAKVGGGHLGSGLAHDNEAPYPEKVPEFFIRSYCPPGGIVLDPFSGSGTTCAVAERFGRIGVGMDLRDSQCLLGMRRCAEVQAELFS